MLSEENAKNTVDRQKQKTIKMVDLLEKLDDDN